MARVLSACPTQTLPTSKAIPLGGGTIIATPSTPRSTAPVPTKPSNRLDPQFGTCREANAAGYGLYYDPTRATHSKPAASGGIASGKRPMDALDDTPRLAVTHSMVGAVRKPLTCEDVDKVVPEPPQCAVWTVVDAPRWHESAASHRKRRRCFRA